MSDKTAIEWTDATWNPIRGCSRISEGCRNCYAERVAARFSGPGQPYEGLARMTPSGPRWTGKVVTVPGHLDDPVKWKEPRMIFVNSMSDLFHESLSFQEIARIFGVMRRAPQHIYQILTKRSDRMLKFFNSHLSERAPHNWWLGVSVEDQPAANLRIPDLLNTWATVRWLSVEPLLGPIELVHRDEELPISFSWLDGFDGCDPEIPPLDWVVVGGESGPGARPMHPKWARQIRDQCIAFTTPFFFKQWGEWAEDPAAAKGRVMQCITPTGETIGAGDGKDGMLDPHWKEQGGACMVRVGKKAAGRTLDGREWNEYPVGGTRDFVTPVLEALKHGNDNRA